MNRTLKAFNQTIEDISALKAYDEAILLTPITEGKWSIREIVAHLYNWDKYNAEEMVPLIEHGARLPDFPDHDTHNAAGLAALENKSVYEIIDLFVQMRTNLIDRLAQVDKQARFTIGEGKRSFSAESFAKIFVRHDGEHLPQIKAQVDS
ncbi:DinB family protein [Bacillus sp. JCM 19041]|uniref:DinB family protein n=1 Tax=Bacillus sp. JCM 19041 TaxID=1460637 RepID=UPI0006D28657